MLKINNLHAHPASKAEHKILQGLSLDVPKGEVHAIMGPNGSGKSTLSSILAGKPGYEVSTGSATFNNQDLLELEPNERAHAGLYLAFQYPVELPGVNVAQFLRASCNAVRTARGEAEYDAPTFLKTARKALDMLHMPHDVLKRAVNVGFSGGEKKRFDMLHMALLQPQFAILDETDSGLDIDALKIVADSVNQLRSPERSFLVITHYQRLLDYIKPDRVHVLANGQIIKSGGPELALELEENGYDHVINAA